MAHVALVDPIDLSEFDLTPERATFGPLWAQYFSDADGLDTQDLIDAGALTAGDVAGMIANIDGPLGIADVSLAAEQLLPADPEVPKAELGSAPVDDAFQQAFLVIPPEGFQPVPPDLGGPAQLGSLTPPPPPTQPSPTQPPIPGRPPGAPGEPGAGPGQPPAPTPAQQPLVQLVNTTDPAKTFFSVGDHFTLTVKGAAYGALMLHPTFNGHDLGTTAYGSLDSTGTSVIKGVMGTQQIGEWFETWLVNGVAAIPVLHFSVV